MQRMKSQYEERSKTFLPRRTYTVIRIDGKSFTKFCKGLKKPFDAEFIKDMNETAKYLCENIQGAKFAFVQSDEISILLTDFEKNETDAWFDNEVQKMVSVSASLAAAKFNHLRLNNIFKNAIRFVSDIAYQMVADEFAKMKLAAFDSRVFTIPDPIEVGNYFVARQRDCTRNSISMAAQSVYSHHELSGKSTSIMQEMMFQKGINWNDYPTRWKRGGFIQKISFKVPGSDAERTKWEIVDPPVFTQDFPFLYSQIPVIATEVISLQEMLDSTKKELA